MIGLSKYHLDISNYPSFLGTNLEQMEKELAKLGRDRDCEVVRYTEVVMDSWDNFIPPEAVPEQIWVPKNREINFMVGKEKDMTAEFWAQSNFPYRSIPREVSTHVNVKEWINQMNMLSQDPNQTVQTKLMREVLYQLINGVDSGVIYPGTGATYTGNFFPEPQIDIPRIADALCTEVKQGHMAGPLDPGEVPNAKINGLMSVKKPDGSRQQVGNLSSPKGRSFNDGILDTTLKIWPVRQTTSRQFAEKIARAGRGAVLCCCDLVNAYKCLPVCKKQQRLQAFKFGEKLFVDLRMVFGDQSACMYFDRFHWCIVEYSGI